MSREIFDLPPYSEIWKDTKKRTPLSKERELLREIMGYIASGVVSITSNDLGDAAETLHEIQELLAQPEQEPKFNFDLERMKAAIESPISNVTVDDLVKQVKQEPVAWMVETHFNNEPIKEIHTVKPMERVYKYCIVTELYAAPLKPLTGIEISNGFKADDEATHPYSYWAGVEFAEKHHGIGGGE